MKRSILGLALLALGLTSCDMDTTNYGTMGQDVAINSKNAAKQFTNGLYIQIRSMSAGSKMSVADIQMDKFVGTLSNGNRLGNFSTGQIVVADQDITGFYQTAYSVIASANYFLPWCESLIENEYLDDKDKAELRSMKAVGYFARAYSYTYLFDKFVNYKESDLDAPGKGLQIVTVYDPSGDRSTYVGRSTIRETVEFINKDLELAFESMKEWDESGSNDTNIGAEASFLNEYVVASLQARFALLTQDYATALEKAEYVINSGIYELCDTRSYSKIWSNDTGAELIFVPFASVNGGGGIDIGSDWVGGPNKNQSDYLPTADALLAYDIQNDVRFDSFFSVFNINIAGITCQAYGFSKFFGNPELFTTAGSNNMRNKAKPFRLSEQYLIAAEACCTDGPAKDETKANEYLNAIREARIIGYEAKNYSGLALVEAVRDERTKELIGEGFRLSDLRRWGLGFTRKADFSALGAPLDQASSYVLNSTDNVTYTAGNYRFTWPIPYREMSVNPQLKGQQNPGY